MEDSRWKFSTAIVGAAHQLYRYVQVNFRKPLMMAEYFTKSWMETALVIHSSLTVENVVLGYSMANGEG